MSEEELKDLLDKNKNLKLIRLNDAILKKVKSSVKEYIIRIREYGMAEVFTPEKFSEIEHLLECNFLMNALNMNTDFGISRIIRFQDSKYYYAELVSEKSLVLEFSDTLLEGVENLPDENIANALDVLTFPYKYLHSLSKKDRLAADRLLRKYAGDKKVKHTLPIYSRNPRADYIRKLKKDINELRNTPPGKVDKSKVARKRGIPVSSFDEELKNHKIDYHQKRKLFEDLETGEFF
jgi:hypothetical protein